jgi:hypothetical protein
MLSIYECPLPAAITDIPAFLCGEDFGQIQKIVFQRRQSVPTFATLAAAQLLAAWTPLLAAIDDTKAQTTPFFENFVIPGVTAITEGGDDNTTLDGVAVVTGRSTPLATGNFRSLPADIFTAIEKYNGEPNLTVFFINEYEKVIGHSENGTTFEGIPITEFFIGDKDASGKNTNSKNLFQFALRAGWTKKVKFMTPTDFNPRYDLNS